MRLHGWRFSFTGFRLPSGRCMDETFTLLYPEHPKAHSSAEEEVYHGPPAFVDLTVNVASWQRLERCHESDQLRSKTEGRRRPFLGFCIYSVMLTFRVAADALVG